MTDTPIYDQMEWEFRSGGGGTEPAPRSGTRASRRQDGASRRPVSVWTLVEAHRKRS